MAKKIIKPAQGPKPIVITIDNWSKSRLNELIVTAKDRRELNTLLFKDTLGRTRLAMDGEPLVTNMDGPAISYPDGEEEFYVHGHQTSFEFLPGVADFVHYDSTGDIWKNINGTKVSLALDVCHAACSCDEDDSHGWEFMLGFEDSDFEIVINVDFDDIHEFAGIFDNHLDMNPLAIFHTMEFAHRLLAIFSSIQPGPGAYPFLIPEAEERILFQIHEQINEYVKTLPVEVAAVKKEEDDLGSMAMAGLAAVAAGVVGVLAKNNEHKQANKKKESKRNKHEHSHVEVEEAVEISV